MRVSQQSCMEDLWEVDFFGRALGESRHPCRVLSWVGKEERSCQGGGTSKCSEMGKERICGGELGEGATWAWTEFRGRSV